MNLKQNKLNYIEKSEINLYNKGKLVGNDKISNINKAFLNAESKKNHLSHDTSEKNKLNTLKNNSILELKNLEKIHNAKNSDLHHFLTSSVDRTKDINKQKLIKSNNVTNKQISSFMDNDLINKGHINIDIIQKKGIVSEVLSNRNKSRNNQTIFEKNILFNTERNTGNKTLNYKYNKNFAKDAFALKTLKSFSNIDYNKSYVNIGIKSPDNFVVLLNNLNSKKINSTVNNFMSNGLAKNNGNNTSFSISMHT
jgi:hypothetical protein